MLKQFILISTILSLNICPTLAQQPHSSQSEELLEDIPKGDRVQLKKRVCSNYDNNRTSAEIANNLASTLYTHYPNSSQTTGNDMYGEFENLLNQSVAVAQASKIMERATTNNCPEYKDVSRTFWEEYRLNP